MEKGSSSSSSKKLSLINEYLQSTQEQLRSVKYPNNITRLKVLQRAFINECIRLNEDEITLSNYIKKLENDASTIVKILETRRKEKKRKAKLLKRNESNNVDNNNNNNSGSNNAYGGNSSTGNVDYSKPNQSQGNNNNNQMHNMKNPRAMLKAQGEETSVTVVHSNNTSYQMVLPQTKNNNNRSNNNRGINLSKNTNNMVHEKAPKKKKKKKKILNDNNNYVIPNANSTTTTTTTTTTFSSSSTTASINGIINTTELNRNIGTTSSLQNQKRNNLNDDGTTVRDLPKGKTSIMWQGNVHKETQSRLYFKGCVIGTAGVLATLVRPGEAYLLSTGDSSETPYIAFCQDIYFDKRANEAKMTAQWFFRHEDLLDDEMKSAHPLAVDGHTSIFLSTQVEENPIESVLSRAYVLYSTDFSPDELKLKKNEMSETTISTFYCGNFLNVVSRKLMKLQSNKFRRDRKPAKFLTEATIRKNLNYSNFLFPLHFLGLTTNKMKRSGINNNILINKYKNFNNNVKRKRKHLENQNSGNSIDSDSGDEQEKKPRVMKGGFIPLLHKRSHQLLKVKHAGEYKYYVEGGSSFMRNGTFTNMGKKNLSKYETRKNKGTFRGYEQACAVLIDLHNHRMTSTREDLVKIGGTRSIQIFLSPVNVKDFPDYLDIVKHPMDFSTIDKKLHTYKTFDEFAKDVELIFDNCRLYNPPEESYEVCALADGLRDYFLKACEVINVLFKEEDEKNNLDGNRSRSNSNVNVRRSSSSSSSSSSRSSLLHENKTLQTLAAAATMVNINNTDKGGNDNEVYGEDDDALMNSITESAQPFLADEAVEL